MLYKLHGDDLHAHEHLHTENKKYQYGGDSSMSEEGSLFENSATESSHSGSDHSFMRDRKSRESRVSHRMIESKYI